MSTLEIDSRNFFGEEFRQSIYELADGERVRTCIQCGTCGGVCPFGPWMELSPRNMIRTLREGHLDRLKTAESVWLCVSCCACATACPQQIPLTTALISRTREELLLAGSIPAELQQALQNSQRYGNADGASPRKRAEWAKAVQPRVRQISKVKGPVDKLWYVGDYASYHPRVQKTVQALARILFTLGIDFAILGKEEVSDGDSQRLAGEKGLFELLAEKNGRAFEKYTFNEIITTDPHAFNAFKNEYPQLGISYPVRHYTELLFDYLDELKPLLTHKVEAMVTYHDPCYLGRANGIYEQPRALLEAIPGLVLIEMSHSRANSLCCGNGGGGLWLQGYQWEKTQSRLSAWRVEEAARAAIEEPFVTVIERKKRRKAYRKEIQLPEARILAVACPYETPCFEEAVKIVPEASKLQVMDIAELLALSMGI